MKKIVSILVLVSICSYATSLKTIYKWYNAEKYSKICSNKISNKEYYRYNDDENFVNIYADSCLKTDMINRLAIPITQLRKTKSARANALYYTTVIYQKKLLHHALIDGLSDVPNNLPTTSYILSKIYDKFANKDYKKDGDKYLFEDGNSTVSYKLYTRKDDDGYEKLVLKTMKDGKSIKTRLYW